jgi:hypothetical protein
MKRAKKDEMTFDEVVEQDSEKKTAAHAFVSLVVLCLCNESEADN